MISIGWPYSVRWLLIMNSYDGKARPLNGLLQLRLSWYTIDVKSQSQTTTCLLDPLFVDQPLVDIRDLMRVVEKHGTGPPRERVDHAKQGIRSMDALDRRRGVFTAWMLS